MDIIRYNSHIHRKFVVIELLSILTQFSRICPTTHFQCVAI